MSREEGAQRHKVSTLRGGADRLGEAARALENFLSLYPATKKHLKDLKARLASSVKLGQLDLEANQLDNNPWGTVAWISGEIEAWKRSAVDEILNFPNIQKLKELQEHLEAIEPELKDQSSNDDRCYKGVEKNRRRVVVVRKYRQEVTKSKRKLAEQIAALEGIKSTLQRGLGNFDAAEPNLKEIKESQAAALLHINEASECVKSVAISTENIRGEKTKQNLGEITPISRALDNLKRRIAHQPPGGPSEGSVIKFASGLKKEIKSISRRLRAGR